MADNERELMAGLLSKGASFRLFVRGTIGPKELETLIKKLEIDKDILAVPDDGDAAADIFNRRGATTMASQGIVGQTAQGVVKLEDADPNTTGTIAPEGVTFESEDEAVAEVVQNDVDPLKCTVTLVGVGTSAITCTVDPGAGEPFSFAVDVEARAPEPGEAVAEGSTFELGAFEPVA